MYIEFMYIEFMYIEPYPTKHIKIRFELQDEIPTRGGGVPFSVTVLTHCSSQA
jgi:hypothetical protein